MKNKFKNKNVLIVGMGKSGQSALELLNKLNAFCYIFDDKKQVLEQYSNKNSCNVLWKIDENVVKIMDYMIISPGVSIFSEYVKLAKLFGVKVISEVELGSYFLKGKIIGITGSNGKTTTASLVYAILKQAGKSCVLCGNIGDPLTANLLPYKANYVVEMSSFQLESVDKLKVDVSAITNITQNHIDRHLNFENYKKAKYNIFKNSGRKCHLILNYDDENLKEISNQKRKFKTALISTDKEIDGYFEKNNKIFFKHGKKIKFLFDISKCKLVGKHNISNILVATAICKELGVKEKYIEKAINEFAPLAHRLQFVRDVNGVAYYNDSKSTSPDSTITAINSFDKKPVVLMLGGSDKNTNFDYLAKKIAKSDIKLVVVCGETAEKIVKSLKKAKFNEYAVANDFETAFHVASVNAESGDVVLLSPACASFDYFKSYEERGEKFEELVKGLENQKV